MASSSRGDGRAGLIRERESFMENQNNKDNQKVKPSLPPLLSGSEYKTNDRYCHRRMNLLGLAVTIVVYAKKDGISGDY